MPTQIIAQCPECGSDGLEVDHKFCAKCGHDLTHQRSTLDCCGATGLFDHAFKHCPFCGRKQ